MDHVVDRLPAEIARTLEQEMRLLREGIALVAAGRAPRVIVANLRLGQQLLEPARRLGRESTVLVVPLWHADEEGVDFAIEPAPETDA